MAWEDKVSNQKTYIIHSVSEDGLAEGLLDLFSEIEGHEFEASSELLIFIDATNGSLFISAYSSKSEEVFDEKGIFVLLEELWESIESYDFDEIVLQALRTAYSKSENSVLRSKFNVFYQTEEQCLAMPLH
ncbi:hypothetical protein RCC89_11490 [Cytophagaceae bacterium ABcell3]|nr:hypothetical protein RCC89_11490 [Cytophagaceae bacterium ABcell3]